LDLFGAGAMKNCGVLYFLTAGEEVRYKKKVKKSHGRLLVRSVETLKRHMKNIKTVLFTNVDIVNWKKFGLDTVVYKKGPADVWTYKYDCLLKTPFEKTVHLDCDTYICEDFYEVFHMLNNVDFAAPFSPWYFANKPLRVPRSFPELAGGFMAYNSNDKVNKVLEYTRKLVAARGSGCDEPYLRKALYDMDIKFSVLPWEYNCVVLLPGFILSKVKVLHGKMADIDSIEKSMTAEGPKLFTGEKVIHCDYVRKKTYKMGLVEKCGHDYE
jgi:hypothetical protein